jgi:tripartite ATP-independent transporter DctP family solute receptor
VQVKRDNGQIQSKGGSLSGVSHQRKGEEKMNKKCIALLLAATTALSLTACGGSGSSTTATTAAAAAAPAETTAVAAPASTGKAEYEINIGHINDERDSWHQGALKFKEYVEEKSGGRIAVNVYPNSQLGTEVEMIQSILTQGGCDITFTGESMQTYQPDLGIIGMPYLIKSDEHMDAVLTGEVGKELEDLMDKAGMKVLGYYMRGPRNITSNKKITSPADMNNFVIRTPQSAMTVAAFEAVGAKPTPMALAEVFTSLQQGTIEGQENPLAMIQNSSFYEVQKYVIRSEHLRAWVYIAMGKAQFEALPADLQEIVVEGGKEMQAYEHELFLENEKNLEQTLKDEGMEFVDVDQDAFADAMTAGVLNVLSDSQKVLYEKIKAADPAAK